MATNRTEIIAALSKYIDTGLIKTLHVAILQKPYLQLILSGHKTIESRLSQNKIAPYHKVIKGDSIVFKKSGGEILAMAEVE